MAGPSPTISDYVQVLRDTSASNYAKWNAANELGKFAAFGGGLSQRAIEAAGGLPPLVALLREGNDDAKSGAAYALQYLARNNVENAAAIVACGGRAVLEAMASDCREEAKIGRQKALEALKLLPEKGLEEGALDQGKVQDEMPKVEIPVMVVTDKPLGGPLMDFLFQLRAAISSLESETEQCEAAEQLENWAAASDEKRVMINRAGGCEALVALVVTGSDEAKCLAARALTKLSYNQEAKAAILTADGIAMLTPLAKHGKGKVKEAASEALQLLSQKLDPKCPSPSGYPNAAVTGIPTGAGTRVAMFSARFDGGPMEEKFRKVYSILRDHKYDILMVAADAGESFADLTTEYLGRLQEEQGTMLAVSTKHYGEMTASAYSSHKELKFALDYEKDVKFLPLKVEDTYPPQPPGGPEHTYDKKGMAKKYILSVFKPGLVYLDCRNKSERDIAADIAEKLQKNRK